MPGIAPSEPEIPLCDFGRMKSADLLGGRVLYKTVRVPAVLETIPFLETEKL
jgi:hypothetical protein